MILKSLSIEFLFFVNFYLKNDFNSFRINQQQHRHQAKSFVSFVTIAKKDVVRSWLMLFSLRVTKYHYRLKIWPKIWVIRWFSPNFNIKLLRTISLVTQHINQKRSGLPKNLPIPALLNIGSYISWPLDQYEISLKPK